MKLETILNQLNSFEKNLFPKVIMNPIADLYKYFSILNFTTKSEL